MLRWINHAHIACAMKKQGLNSFFRNQDGATAIEYGLIAAGISVAIIAVVFSIGNEANDMFSGVRNNASGSGAE